MLRVYQIIVLLACGTFLLGCEEDQSIKNQDQEIVIPCDPEFLTDNHNTRTSAPTVPPTVALNVVRVWLKRDQWAGGQYRMVVSEKESGDVIFRSVWVSVADLPTGNSSRRSFSGGNRLVEVGLKHQIKLEFTHVHDDVGKVFATASLADVYDDGCGPACSYDLTFETSNKGSDGVVYVDQSQLLREKYVTMNGFSPLGQEFVPQESN